jgi:ABC-type branched-subunit amino acid transport system ATPase component
VSGSIGAPTSGPALRPPDGAAPVTASNDIPGSSLELRGVSKSFGGRKVVDIEALDLGKHRIEGLIGPNGAGKTTLMNAITQRVRLDAGTVRYIGPSGSHDVTGRSVDAVARLGIIKTNQLIRDFAGLTIRDSLLLSLAGEGVERPHRIASEGPLRAETAAAIDSFLDYFGLTDADRDALSAGEKKLLDIIRCLAVKPRLLLMDEPTAGLPEDETRRVMDLVSRLAVEQDFAVVIVEHDLGLIWDVCQFIHFMADGQVLEQGTADQIRHSRLVAEKYLGVADG